MQASVRIVLVNPSHPGNIGAAARAMKTMGIEQLVLVNPKDFPHQEAYIRASGAEDILDRALIVEDLIAAIENCHVVFGTSARNRSLPWPTCSPKSCAQQIMELTGKEVAIVFGRERTGLTNEELAYCHYHVQIPTISHFSSLNLAAAVQVLVYEIFSASLQSTPQSQTITTDEVVDDLATAGQMAGFYQHLEAIMCQLGILDPNHPRLLLQRMQRLFNRAHLEVTELNILRGLFSAINKHLSNSHSD